MMKKLIFILILGLVLLFSGRAFATTYTAASASASDVQAAMNLATADGDIVVIPATAGTTWTAKVTWSPPPNATLEGAGTTATGGGDQTVIADGVTSNSNLLVVTIPSSGTFRMTGITFEGSSTGVNKDNGQVVFTSGGGMLHIDHCHFDTTEYTQPTPARSQKILVIGNGVFGVADHCIFDLYGASAPYIYNGAGSDGKGNQSWADPTDFGGADYFYFEDNIFNGYPTDISGTYYYETRVCDGWSGAWAVFRFNTLHNCSGPEEHGTGHAGDDRGFRSIVYYGNYDSNSSPLATPNNGLPAKLITLQTGTALVWGNSAVNTYQNGLKFDTTRKDDTTYVQVPSPEGWSYGGTDFWSGTVDTSGTSVTWVSGTEFSFTNSQGGTSQMYDGDTIVINGTDYTISGTPTATSATLTTSAGTQTGVAYYVPSPWDGSTAGTGYPNIDQPGRGQGDLITGLFSSKNKVDSVSGTVEWPNQALEPIYIWDNDFGTTTKYLDLTSTASGSRVVANRDYYPQASGIQTSATSPFDGTTGTGWGTLANRPTTCTTGVGYFATDQGSWNQSASNPYGVNFNGASGILYIATATNTWTAYYSPHTYPHPLQQQESGGGGIPPPGYIHGIHSGAGGGVKWQ